MVVVVIVAAAAAVIVVVVVLVVVVGVKTLVILAVEIFSLDKSPNLMVQLQHDGKKLNIIS